VFDSGVGVAACAHLAAALDASALAAAAAAAAEAAAAEAKALTDARDGVDHRWSSYDGGDRDDGLHAGSRLGTMAHGLGTGAWLAGDVMVRPSLFAHRVPVHIRFLMVTKYRVVIHGDLTT